MGNAAGKLTPCLCTAGAGDVSGRHDIAVVLRNPLSEDCFGHSFCYINPDNFGNSSVVSTSLLADNNSSRSSSVRTSAHTYFRTISGASISANATTALSTSLLLDSYPCALERASSFESSPSFASVPLQPVPRNFISSGPLPSTKGYFGSGSGSGSFLGSGPIERRFLSGPIERGYLSGPMDQHKFDQKLEKIKSKYSLNKWGSIKGIKESIFSALNIKGEYDDFSKENSVEKGGGSVNFSCQMSLYDDNDNTNANVEDEIAETQENVQWAQGKAGEDRVHIVVSEDHGWVFVGIYDGFNGPDAPDYLLSNLYSNVRKELKGLLLGNESKTESELGSNQGSNQSTVSKDSSFSKQFDEEMVKNSCSWCVVDQESGDSSNLKSSRNNVLRNNRQILELDEKVREKLNKMGRNWSRKMKHSDVLKALSEALRKTEEAYLDVADKMMKENPELSLMGSCVLAMLMIGEDVYLMNVGDCRAVLGQKSANPDCFDDFPSFTSLQLTVDHNTYVKEEVQRIKREHPDDPSAVVNDRVKGSLKVTRAFGAGFLKQRRWNDALLEMFQIEYVGNSPYLTCSPSLSHHKLGSRDKFLILSSDGLYQYFTNEEAVSQVELFMASTPEGDPAQHLIEEVLFRAAKKAGMDLYDLLDIPQGERRRYHDDVSVIVISLERQIRCSSV